ncbi:thioredoxin family protein [Aureliella helgolandensis]|nr:DUF255 domain-containing protein [Aureliella helgolandensis]
MDNLPMRYSAIPIVVVALCISSFDSETANAQQAVFEKVKGLLSSKPTTVEQVTWLRSAQEAAGESAKTGKPILIYVRSKSCHYCDLMQRNVWEDPETAAAIMRDFIPLKLTREENPEAIEALQIQGYPATLIFSSQQRFLDRIDGYVEAPKFLQAAQRARMAAGTGSVVR